ncbi:unnamed protein product [Sympodiomycopsis kandeliae]
MSDAPQEFAPLRAARVRPKRNGNVKTKKFARPTTAKIQNEIRAEVNKLNLGRDDESICQWLGLSKECTEKSHVLPHSELNHSRLFVWARSIGLLSCTSAASLGERLLPTNIIRLGKHFHSYLTDGAAAQTKSPRLILFPTREDLHRAISFSERALANEEARDGGGHWDFSAANLLSGWPSKVVRNQTSCDVFNYQLLFFTEPNAWNSAPPFIWMSGSSAVVPLALTNDTWPTKFTHEFPTRQLPINIFFAVLSGLSQMYYLDTAPPISKEMDTLLREGDYLLSLAETETTSSWRSIRPQTLPFPAPDLPHTSTRRARQYFWPQIRTRSRQDDIPGELYSSSSDEPGASSQPLPRLLAQGHGLAVAPSSEEEQAGCVRIRKRPSSSSSSSGSEADDEWTSGPPEPRFSSDSSIADPPAPPIGQLEEALQHTLHLASSPEESEDLSGTSIAESAAEELEATRQDLVQELFDTVHESDSPFLALQTLRTRGVGALDPLLFAKFNAHDSDRVEYDQWCRHIECI